MCKSPAVSICLRILAETSVFKNVTKVKKICSVLVGSSADLLCANADLGQYVANSVSRPTANADGLARQTCDPRGKHLRNSDTRLQYTLGCLGSLSLFAVCIRVCMLP